MKCSAKCRYYQVATTHEGFEVYCAIRGFTIKDIKNKFPEIYLNCSKFQEVKGR